LQATWKDAAGAPDGLEGTEPMPPGSTLALLVPRIGADHTHHTVAADDLALAANLLYGSLYFHDDPWIKLSGLWAAAAADF
jgi:hypothetical protein